MRGLIYKARGQVSLEELPDPVIEHSDDVLVRLLYSGLCGTDHKIILGKLSVDAIGQILGHEGVGEVIEVGTSVSDFKTGDIVAINPTQGCLSCQACMSGKYCYCDNFDDHQLGFTLPGTFAEKIVVRSNWLVKVPDGISPRLASLVEPLGCCLNTVVKAQLHYDDSVLVIGGGAIGAMCAAIAMKTALSCVVSEYSDYRRKILESLNIVAIDPEEIDDSNKYDVIIDAVGNMGEFAVRHLNKGGRLVLMGYDSSYSFPLHTTYLIDNGIDVIANVPLHNALLPAMEILAQNTYLEQLITAEFVLDDFEMAFETTMGCSFDRTVALPLSNMKAVLKLS